MGGAEVDAEAPSVRGGVPRAEFQRALLREGGGGPAIVWGFV